LPRPLDVRRSEIERISWVESASVQRILRNLPARRADGAHSVAFLLATGNQLLALITRMACMA